MTTPLRHLSPMLAAPSQVEMNRLAPMRWSIVKVKAVLFGAAVIAADLLLDRVVPLFVGRSWTADLIAAFAVGALAAYAMYRYMRYRLRLSEERAAQIAELNHQIRNALQALTLSSYPNADDAQRLQIIRAASIRIAQALTVYTEHDKAFARRRPWATVETSRWDSLT
jgi:acyl-CoA synthetase (NDP forming)